MSSFVQLLMIYTNVFVCCVKKRDDQNRNVYNYHLATCPDRPAIIDDNKVINAKIDKIVKEVAQKKAEEEEKKNAFKCPYCGRKFKAESIIHLLQCALKAERSGAEAGKLKAYFESK